MLDCGPPAWHALQVKLDKSKTMTSPAKSFSRPRTHGRPVQSRLHSCPRWFDGATLARIRLYQAAIATGGVITRSAIQVGVGLRTGQCTPLVVVPPPVVVPAPPVPSPHHRCQHPRCRHRRVHRVSSPSVVPPSGSESVGASPVGSPSVPAFASWLLPSLLPSFEATQLPSKSRSKPS